MVAARTADLLREAGNEVEVFTRSSKLLAGLAGSIRAAGSGLYAPVTLHEFNGVLDRFKPDVVHAHEVYPLITPWIFMRCKQRGIRTVMTCHDYRLSCPVATHFRDGRLCYECGYQGDKVSRVQGDRVTGLQGDRVTGLQGDKVAGLQGGKVSRLQGGKVAGLQSGWACVRHNCCGSRGKSVAYAARNVLAWRKRLFVDYVDLFLTPSEKAKEILCRHSGLSPDRVQVVGNPVAPLFETVPDFVQGEYVAYAGRFEPEKGFNTLVQAIQEADVPLKVAGNASAYLKKCGTSSASIEFVGHLNREELASFYHRARMVVVPSLWHETFGLVVAEALGCMTPVVVSDMGALPEVAGPGGIVVPAGDVHALREAMVSLWNDPVRCRKLGEAGWEHVRRYNEAAYVERVVEGYQGDKIAR